MVRLADVDLNIGMGDRHHIVILFVIMRDGFGHRAVGCINAVLDRIDGSFDELRRDERAQRDEHRDENGAYRHGAKAEQWASPEDSVLAGAGETRKCVPQLRSSDGWRVLMHHLLDGIQSRETTS